MLVYKVTRSAILCAVALLAIPLLATARPKSTNPRIEKKSIDLDRAATVDGKTLAPGKYEVLIEENMVNFERDGKTVITAQCDWKTLPYKSPYNSTTFSRKNALQELEFEGSKQALEIM